MTTHTRSNEACSVGELVRDGLGHWCQVVERVNFGVYKVQPLTPTGTSLYPLGTPVLAYRSDLRKDGE